jgi:hypothetical protein
LDDPAVGQRLVSVPHLVESAVHVDGQVGQAIQQLPILDRHVPLVFGGQVAPPVVSEQLDLVECVHVVQQVAANVPPALLALEAKLGGPGLPTPTELPG